MQPRNRNTLLSLTARWAVPCLALAGLAHPAPAQPAAPAAAQPAVPAGQASVIAPFIDETTVGVVKVDVGAIQIDALRGWLADFAKNTKAPQSEMDEANKGMDKNLPKARQWQADWAKAGGKSVYVVVEFANPPTVFAVVPLEGNADTNKLTELLKDPFNNGPRDIRYEAAAPPAPGQPAPPPKMTESNPLAQLKGEVIGKALVVTVPQQLAQVKQITPVARPEFASALGGGGNGTVQVAAVMPEAVKALIAFQMPKLPDELGGGATAPLAQGLKWAALSLDSPPQPAIRLTVQAKDADSAGKLRAVFDKALATFQKEEKEANTPEAQRLAAALTPQAAGDQLKITLDTAKLTQVEKDLAPMLAKSRESAQHAVSANNLRQLAVGTIMYANEHKGDLPNNLPDDLKAVLPGVPLDRLMTNPTHPDRKPGYVYIKPADKLTQVKNPAETVILYESFDKWDAGVNAAFADGHVEFIQDQQRFNTLVTNKAGKP